MRMDVFQLLYLPKKKNQTGWMWPFRHSLQTPDHSDLKKWNKDANNEFIV